MVADHDHQRLQVAAHKLYQPGLDAGTYVERAFAFIAGIVPGDLSGHGELDLGTRRLDACFDRHIAGLDVSLDAYRMLMHKYAPFRFDPTVNHGRPWSVLDFYSARQFRDLDIYQEVHARHGFDDHCFVHVPTEAGVTLFFGLFRAGDVFHADDKRLLGLGQRHLAKARHLARSHTAAREISIKPETFAAAGFSTRQCDVLYWLTHEMADHEIAGLLHIREEAVRMDLKAIFEKLGVEDRVSAVICAINLARRICPKTPSP